MHEIFVAEPEIVAEAARRLLAGALVAFPTETYYALGADPRSNDAVTRLFRVKDRGLQRALPLIAGSRDQVEMVAPGWQTRGSGAGSAVRLADAFWPGPLSLILDGSDALADRVRARDGSIAIRVSSHAIAAELARLAGFPVVSTSANRSGARPCRYANEAVDSLRDTPDLFVVDGGATRGGLPSTLVDVRGGGFTVVRQGAIDETALRAALASP